MISAKRSIINEQYQFDVEYETGSANSLEYDSSLCVVRRGTYLNFRLKTLDLKIDLERLGLQIVTMAQGVAEKIEIIPKYLYNDYFSCERNKISEDTYVMMLKTTNYAPIGLFYVSITHDGESVTASLPIFIVFNPHNPSDDAYCEDKSFIDDYLYDSWAKTHFGDGNHYFNKKYQLDQFSLECLTVSDIYLSRMKLDERTCPIIVSREITAFANSEDDNGLIVGNWGEITSGKFPSYWTSMKDIYIEYLKEKRPVKWGQCFVYACLVASLCRSIGIVCRIVTGFSIGSDDNVDGILTIYLHEESMKTLSMSETLWNFHCWNNAWFKRTDILTTEMDSDSKPHGWQHIDGTPQERSKGTYRCGPFPISFMKSHIVNRAIPYDGLSAYQSINASLKYIIVNKENKVVKEIPKIIKRTLLTSNRFISDIDITNEYIDMVSKPKYFDPLKLRAEITVEESVPLGKPLAFYVKIENTSEFSPTVMCVSLQLRNQFGKNILAETMEKSLVFFGKNSSIKGEFIAKVDPIAFDISLCSFYWELRIFDYRTDKVKIFHKNTALQPLFRGTFRTATPDSSDKTYRIFATIKNETSLKLENTKISVHLFNTNITLNEINVIFDPFEEKQLEFKLKDIPDGTRKMIIYSFYGACCQEIGRIAHFSLG